MMIAQDLVRMLTQHLVEIGRVVLAAQREDQAALLKIENAALKIAIGGAGIVGAERDAVDAVFSDHAAPQRVVGVEHQHLGARRLQHHPDTDDAARHLARGLRREWKLRGVPVAPIEEGIAPDLQQHLVEVQPQRRRHRFAHPASHI